MKMLLKCNEKTRKVNVKVYSFISIESSTLIKLSLFFRLSLSFIHAIEQGSTRGVDLGEKVKFFV